MVTLSTQDGKQISAYRQGEEQAIGLVVLQEIFGVNNHIRSVVERFAAAGFDTIAPALFDRVEPGVELGYTPEDIQRGLELRAGVSTEQTLLDIQSAIEALGDKPICIVGYCWGGTLAWLSAHHFPQLKEASCWYGGGIAQHKDLQAKIPVQMHFAELDKSIPLSDVKAIREAQPKAEMYLYSGVDHGFGCEQRGSFNEKAYKLAYERTLQFFTRHR